MINTTVDGVRRLLSQAGYKEIHRIPEETVVIGADNRIITTYFPVESINYLTIPSDLLSANNLLAPYLNDIEINPNGYIQLPPAFEPEGSLNYTISYNIESGLSDQAIEDIAYNARVATISTFNIKKSQKFEIATDPYSLEVQYQLYMLKVIIFECIISLNEVNAIQGDANFSIGYFSEMSKLWGEGHTVQSLMMIKESQLAKLEKKINDNSFKVATSYEPATVYDNPHVFNEWIGAVA